MSNKKLGNTFETEVCNLLFAQGFWAHNMAQNAAGQPADVIAVKNGKAYLIDCKVCSGNRFPLSRVEENQNLSMDLWKLSGNGEGWFALKIKDEIVMIPHLLIKIRSAYQSALSIATIHEYGKSLEKWVNECK